MLSVFIGCKHVLNNLAEEVSATYITQENGGKSHGSSQSKKLMLHLYMKKNRAVQVQHAFLRVALRVVFCYDTTVK